MFLGIERSKSREKSEITDFRDKNDHRFTSFYKTADKPFINPFTRLMSRVILASNDLLTPNDLRAQIFRLQSVASFFYDNCSKSTQKLTKSKPLDHVTFRVSYY